MVCVIGTGLSSVAAIMALVEKGIEPTVFDIGLELPAELKKISSQMASIAPSEWTAENIADLTRNDTLNTKGGLPKKLHFGSDYFYGKPTEEFSIEDNDEQMLPFSQAKGGMSQGWGGAVLLPHNSDLTDWPIAQEDLLEPAKKVLEYTPYSAKEDSLDKSFPIVKASEHCLELSPGDQKILQKLKASIRVNPEEINIGQSRLMTQAVNNNQESDFKRGCIKCGSCMAGCIYGHIYKASQTLNDLIKNKKIIYKAGCSVTKLEKTGDAMRVHYLENNDAKTAKFDKVFLGAGAVNTTRIVLNSFGDYDKPVKLKSRGGFIVPLLSLWPMNISWPKRNTQPGIFLEFRHGKKDKRHWVHTQLSQPNELVYRKLGVNHGTINNMVGPKKFALKRLAVAFCNLNSELAHDYIISIKPPAPEGKLPPALSYKRAQKSKLMLDYAKVLWKLTRIVLKAGYVPIVPSLKINTLSFHVGGTFPMKEQPSSKYETNVFGSPKDWDNLYIVDSSTFPSIPGTTLGLLLMANAQRIVDGVVK